MRGGYDKLRGVVCALDGRMEEGNAYVLFDFFNDFFKKVTEGRADYELIAQEVLG